MSQYPPPHLDPAASPPSLVPAVMATAIASAALFAFPATMGAQEVAVCCMQNCFSAACAGMLGVVPVLLLRKANAPLSPGSGLVVPLLGVFIGGIIGAIIQSQYPAFDSAELREVSAQGVDELIRSYGGDTSGIDREELIERTVGVFRYGVILLAAGSAIVAGGVGLIFGSIAARRRPPGVSG